ncbi:MAG: BglII/BstYI family type II restriction endonuclease [Spirochaetota bacterium]
MFEKLKQKGFEILALHHAEAILLHDMPEAIEEIESVLSEAAIPIEELIHGGGGEAEFTQRLRRKLSDEYNWKKHNFEIKKIVDGIEKESISHEIDHVKQFESGTFALEIEWNNKDPFYDRDLENFKRLHADGVISVGGIITRGSSLHENMKELIEQYALKNNIHDIDSLVKYYNPTDRQRNKILKSAESKGSFAKGWSHAFVSDKFGEATTHWRKLEDRVRRGVGNPCPLILIGIPKDIVIT